MKNKKFNSKGSISFIWYIAAFVLIVGIAGISYTVFRPTAITPPTIKYNGEFSNVAVPDDVGGTDLKEYKLLAITSEAPTGWNITFKNGTTTYVQVTNVPIVEDTSFTTVYVNGQNLDDNTTLNWSFQDATTGNISIVVDVVGSDVCNASVSCNVTVSYTYENAQTSYNETSSNDFKAFFLTTTHLIKGNRYLLAYMFDLDNPVDALEISGTRANVSIEIKEVYIIPDNDEVSMDSDYALWKGTIKDNGEDFELDLKQHIDEGEYVLVIEIKALEKIGGGAALFNTIDMDISGDSLDSGTVSIFTEAGTET